MTEPTIHYMAPGVTLWHGDCIDTMRRLPEASVDAIVTDPPYGLGFMGKAWDDLPPGIDWARECLRVLKPGGHLLAFGGTRTWHRLAVAIEDAGFELRDSIAWLYGSGMPKSMNVAKAIQSGGGRPQDIRRLEMGDAYVPSGRGRVNYDNGGGSQMNGAPGAVELSPEAAAWDGWGTTLKPAFEPVVVARKPLAGTVAATVRAYGTGALNIDASRIGADGRFPANVILDESQAVVLDEQAPRTGGSGKASGPTLTGASTSVARGAFAGVESTPFYGGELGGASRFFYCAKAPKSERPVVDGVAHPTVKPIALMRWLVTLVTPPGGTVLEPFAGSGTTLEAAVLEGFHVIGIEREADYLPLIVHRLTKRDHQQSLFGDGDEQ